MQSPIVCIWVCKAATAISQKGKGWSWPGGRTEKELNNPLNQSQNQLSEHQTQSLQPSHFP